MEDNIKTLKSLCRKTMEKLEECEGNIRAAGGMTVQDVEFLDKLTHMAKSLKTTIAMMEAEEGGESRRSYDGEGRSMEGGNSMRWYPYAFADQRMSRDGGSYDSGSYAENGYSERRGRDRMGRFTSRDAGYSGHGGLEDIMMDVKDMPEADRRKLKQMLDRM